MTKKIKANVVQQVHWDPEWYFTEEDTTVQFAYNMREMLKAFENGKLDNFYLDGRTDALEDYLVSHQEDIPRVQKLVRDNRLFIGPLHAQLDCFISSGEAIISNLKIGCELGDKYGGTSKLAWLPDSFGHTQDFPKIFKGFGIDDFIFRRGMGSEHNLPLDFKWRSNDGSEVLCNVLQAGYGFATPAFVDGTLTDKTAENYQGKDLTKEFHMLARESTLEDEFLLPIGFDLNPTIEEFSELIEKYSNESDEFSFVESTFFEYMDKLRANEKNLKTYEGEFMSAQHHRMHRSLFSARADIKALQDKVERILTYEVQPLMSILDDIGLPYDKGLINRAWDLLIRSQTHSSATNTDKTNELIKIRSARALNIAESCKVYLMRKISVSIPREENKYPLVVFNTLPESRDMPLKINVFSRKEYFKLVFRGEELPYEVVEVERMFSGKYRKDKSLMAEKDYFYRSCINIKLKDVSGFSYETIDLLDGEKPSLRKDVVSGGNSIESSEYKITFDNGIEIFDKKNNTTHKEAIYIEESGDEGDNYDYSYPTNDLIITDFLKDAKIVHIHNGATVSELKVAGSLMVPYDLLEREKEERTTPLKYEIRVKLKEGKRVIEVDGTFDNNALNHRVRVVVKSENKSQNSIAGTQFGFIERPTWPENLDEWRNTTWEKEPIELDGWLEEPSPTYPLLNFVSLKGDNYTVTAHTRGIKEYEIIGDGFTDIALVAFRGVGHLGLPDLNRRPGRASGLQEKLFETPGSQLLGENYFEFGIEYDKTFDGNVIGRNYVEYGTDQCYFQNQRMERVVYPICFLDASALQVDVPRNHKFATIEEGEATFGTLSRAKDDRGYILRVYNNENISVNGGKLKISIPYKRLTDINLSEDKEVRVSEDLGVLKPGEIKNIKIYTK